MEQKPLKKLIIAYVLVLVVLGIALAIIGRVAQRYAAYEGVLNLEPALAGVAVEKRSQLIEETAEVLRARLAHFVPSEGVQFWLGENEIRLRVATRLNTSNLEKILTQRGKLEFAIASDAQEHKSLFDSDGNVINPDALPEGTSLIYVSGESKKQREPLLIKNDTRWTVAPGEISMLWTSFAFDSSGRHYAANILLAPEAAKRLAEMTKENYSKRLAIFIDGECHAAPDVSMFIGTHVPLYVALLDEEETANVLAAIVEKPFPTDGLALRDNLKQSTSAIRWGYTYSALLIGKAARALGGVMLPCLALILIGYRFLKDKTTLSLDEFAATFFKTARSLRRLAPAALPVATVFLIGLLGGTLENIARESKFAARFPQHTSPPLSHEQFVMTLAQRISWLDAPSLLGKLHLGNPSVLSGLNILLPIVVIALYLMSRRRLTLYADTPLAAAAQRTRKVLLAASIAAVPAFLFILTTLGLEMHISALIYVGVFVLSLLIVVPNAIVCATTISLTRQRLDAPDGYCYASLERDTLASFMPLFTFYAFIVILFNLLSLPALLFPRLSWLWRISWYFGPLVKLFLFVPYIVVLEGTSLWEAVKRNFNLLVRQLPAIGALMLLGTTTFFILELMREMTTSSYRTMGFSLFTWGKWSVFQTLDMLIVCFFFFFLFVLFRAAREKAALSEASGAKETPKIPCIT